MSLRILHCGDLHIGMKFNSYPVELRQVLTEARFSVLDSIVKQANEAECQLLVIAGDLFDKTTIPVRDIERVIKTLDKFSGDCVLILPGNHDYDNGQGGLWEHLQKRLTGKILILNEEKPYYLQDYDLDVAAYPAPCRRKHSSTNNLGWMEDKIDPKTARWHIGLAHGSLEGVSPDLNQEYYPMTIQELMTIDVDLWLLGHAHIPYPEQMSTLGQRIFNAGTPEPDGLDCHHEGHAWLLELDDNKEVQGNLLTLGQFRFIDTVREIEDEEGFIKLCKEFSGPKGEFTILRLNLRGVLEPELYNRKEEYYRQLREQLAYFLIDDTELRVRINREVIEQEYTAGSFPYRFLQEFLNRDDQEALQIAYEMLREVKSQ